MYDQVTLLGDPEFFGLRKVTEFDVSEPCYDFDTVVVFFHEDTETYYWARDSGCSCPSPFEDYYVNTDQEQVLIEADIEKLLLTDMDSGGVLSLVRYMAQVADTSSEYVRDQFCDALSEVAAHEQKRSHL